MENGQKWPLLAIFRESWPRLDRLSVRLDGGPARLDGLTVRLNEPAVRLKGFTIRLDDAAARLEGSAVRLKEPAARLAAVSVRREASAVPPTEASRRMKVGSGRFMAVFTTRIGRALPIVMENLRLFSPASTPARPPAFRVHGRSPNFGSGRGGSHGAAGRLPSMRPAPMSELGSEHSRIYWQTSPEATLAAARRATLRATRPGDQPLACPQRGHTGRDQVNLTKHCWQRIRMRNLPHTY